MKEITNFEDLLTEKYGEKGSAPRDEFDARSLAFRLGLLYDFCGYIRLK